MNETEIGRIAAAAAMLRPDWPASSIRTLLQRPELINRPRRDVAVALTWVACETATKTPARVLEAGPWWTASPEGGPRQRAPYDPSSTCAICSQSQSECRRRWHDDHEFLAVDRARSIASVPVPDNIRGQVGVRAVNEEDA